MTIAEKRHSNAARERVREDFLATGDAVRALAARTALVDQLVLDSGNEILFQAVPEGLALVAVGGYGRRQLFPFSDIDILLLFAGERQAEGARESISFFLQTLWDSGLRVSQSVHTPVECVELQDHNIELNISLIDQRFLAGDRTLYARMAERLPRFLHGQREALRRNMTRLARERHEKFQETFYHLEPNVKDGPGGLRDYQLICWLDQLRHTTPARVVLPEPAAELLAAYQFLAKLRCYLHYAAGRDNNVLNFDAQEDLAERINSVTPADWMRRYFREVRTIYRTAMRAIEDSEAQTSSLFSQFRDWRSRLSNADFTVSRERVHFRVPQQLETSPRLALDMFTFVARHGIRPAAEAEERIAAQLARHPDYFAGASPVWLSLREVLSLPHAPLAIRSMHESGVLRALFPELEGIECLVVRDFYHRYTVDEHTLVALQALAGLEMREASRGDGYADLMSELEEPALVRFAILFHDAGKSHPSLPHVTASIRMAETAMERIQMPERDRDTVRFLIGSHLDMSATMNSRDLSDPSTARDMAHKVGTVERLKALTLVTWADINAVNPGAMTPWRSEQLWRLYLLTYNELTRELETERIAGAEAGSAEVQAFLDGFPTRYLRTHSAEEIEAHARLEESSRERKVGIDLAKLASAWRLTLVTTDRPFLFAAVAGTLSSFGLNILKAEAFANRRGTVLDTFTFADPARTLELNPSEIDRLRVMLERAILGKADVRQLLQNRPKPVLPSRGARISARVSFDSEASAIATLIQIVAEDRPGLLYDLAWAISSQECNIEVVLIDTEAHKAIDVFYVTSEGAKLDAAKIESLGEALRAACAARP